MIKHYKTLEGHQNPVYTLAGNQQQNVFYSAGNDKGIVEWDAVDISFSKVLMPVNSSVYSLLYHDEKLYIGQRSGMVSCLNLQENKLYKFANHHHQAVFDIKALADKKEIITTGEDGLINVWSHVDDKHIYSFKSAETTVRTIAVSNDGKEFAVGSKDGFIKIYSTIDFSEIAQFQAHNMPVTSLVYHPHNNLLLSGGRDAQLKIWDIKAGYKLQQALSAHWYSIYSIVFHPSLNIVATASQDKSIKIWDAKDFRLLKIMNLEKLGVGHTHSINKIIWSPDGKFLISTGDDKNILIWTFDID